jgi:hypothetical protein
MYLQDCDMIRAMSEMIPDTRIQIGCSVEIKLLSRSGESEQLEFDLVPDEQADYEAGFLGASTPLARAILGEKAGITLPYFTEELMAIEILSVRESTRKTVSDTASQRKAALKEAKEQIEFTNAMLFAASVDTKWGSYDADGLDYEAWKAGQPEDKDDENKGQK